MENSVIITRILVAILLGTIIGIEREIKSRPAGMRTHILVCMGACTISLIESFFTAGIDTNTSSTIAYNFGRLSAQVISGIGFLGAGTILLSDRKITGLTTAASLWNTACLGLAIGYGYFVIAIAGSIFVLVVLLLLPRLIHVRVSKKLEVRFVHRVETIEFVNKYFERHGIQTSDIDFSVTTEGDRNIYTNIYTLHLPAHLSYTEIVNHLSEHQNILSVHTTTV